MLNSLAVASVVAFSAWLTARNLKERSYIALSLGDHSGELQSRAGQNSDMCDPSLNSNTRPRFQNRVNLSRPLFRGGLYLRKYRTYTLYMYDVYTCTVLMTSQQHITTQFTDSSLCKHTYAHTCTYCILYYYAYKHVSTLYIQCHVHTPVLCIYMYIHLCIYMYIHLCVCILQSVTR